MIAEETSLLIQEYYKQNSYYQIPIEYTTSWTQGNTFCGDTITVYITIVDSCVVSYAYSGSPAEITKAAAEFLGEFLLYEKIETILTRDADRVRSKGFEVSHRRIRSSISALLAVRNAIHDYLHDDEQDEYEDLID